MCYNIDIYAMAEVRSVADRSLYDFSRLYGNEAIKAALIRAAETGRVAHAYLLEGGDGSGKTTLAFLFSAALCCESEDAKPCMRCPSCRKILRAQSPDLCTLGLDALPFADAEDGAETAPAKARSIGVDAVRLLKSDVYIRPNDLDRKLYIIGHAERMTVQAQNALLKILEEPPEGAVFFLLCENRAALLPTVLSRVQRLTMESFPDETLFSLLCTHDREAASLARREEETLQLFVRLADGAFGRASAYVHAQKKALRDDLSYDAHEGAAQLLDQLFSDLGSDDSPLLSGTAEHPRPTRTGLLASLSGRIDPKKDGAEARERLRALIDALCAAIRDLTMCAQGAGGQLLFYPTRTQPETLAARCSARTLSDTFRALTELRAELAANPNVGMLQMTLSGILIGLRI